MGAFSVGEDHLSHRILVALGQNPNPSIKVSTKIKAHVEARRQLVDKALAANAVVYGVNTGFGYLSNVCIAPEDLQQLQLNLIRSHACGVGEPMPLPMVRSLLALRIHGFAKGNSAVRLDCINALLNLLKHDLLPSIPMKGSVGASGDLAPQAHMALTLLGEGPAFLDGKSIPARDALARLGIPKLELQAKEGLSLINGTQFMTVLAAYAVHEAEVLAATANVAAAMSLDAIRGTPAPFDARIHEVRPQSGQIKVAAHIRQLLEGRDEIRESRNTANKVQDPYCFRCVPQVHGASCDAIEYASRVVEIELNSVTDNPMVFDEGEFLSGGNFHGAPVAMAMDFLGIAVAELGSISERRIEKMTNPNFSDLQAFLTKKSGLNSGYMIPHVVAAALTSENKGLATPASVDNVTTSADKEDHVSMGPRAAQKALEINHNAATILAIELLAACQAFDLLKPLTPSPRLLRIYQKVRSVANFMEQDASLSEDINRVQQMVKRGEFIENDPLAFMAHGMPSPNNLADSW